MIDPVLLLAALLTGLAGAGHCFGMCGGIAGALSQARPGGQASPWHINAAYSAGRITTYALLGLLVGGSAALLAPADMGVALLVARLLTACALLLVALHLLGISRWLSFLERIGGRAWRKLTPLVRRLLPATTMPRAFGVGLCWGLLPCGLVYGGLLYAATSGSGLAGAAVMACFGIGTLPAVLALGAAAGALARRAAGLRLASGGLLLTYGIWTLISTLLAWPAIRDGVCRSPGDVYRYALGALTHINEVIP